jgi:O-antigen/teichoic acid export membrane protein
MNGLRRALLFSTGERYFCLTVNFAMIAIVSRLLTPGEIGIWAIVTAIITVAFSVREFATASFLIPQKELRREQVRTAFTVMLVLTVLIACVLSASAKMIAAAYDTSNLALYLRVVSISIILELVAAPIVTLLRREMSFDKVAIINVTYAGVNAGVTIALAYIGFSYMSFAWGLVCAAAASGILALLIRPDYWIFRPLLDNWREMLIFGGYNGTNVMLYRIYEAIPALLIGRVISFDAVGIYNRAMVTSQLPDKVLLSGVVSVALPAFSAHVREHPNLKGSYLKAVEYITGVQWPALAVLAILAHPVVMILLGAQWLGVVPLVQIIAIGWLFSFAFELNYPLLQSIGALRDTLTRALIAWPLSALIITIAAFLGLTAVAFSYWITIPLQAFIAFHFVRRHAGFSWGELLVAMQKSALVTVCAAAGPLAVVALSEFRFDISIGKTLVAGALAAIGWLAGLWFTRHPLLGEVRLAANALRRFTAKCAC